MATPKVKYYCGGSIKVVGGTVYHMGNNGRYIWDFYHDEDDFIKPENECSKKEALKYYVSCNGTDEGFYEFEFRKE